MFKKLFLFAASALLLSACTLEQFFLLPEPAPVPLATVTSTRSVPPTLTPVRATQTYTVTPTLAGYKTVTPTSEFTLTAEPSQVPLVQITLVTPTPTFPMKGFTIISVSGNELFKKGCEPSSVHFVAQAFDPSGTALVALFVRLKSKLNDGVTDWTMIMIKNNGNGTFTHDLKASEIRNFDPFNNVWIQYQFVAYNKADYEVGRTGIFSNKLTLYDCGTPVP